MFDDDDAGDRDAEFTEMIEQTRELEDYLAAMGMYYIDGLC